MVRTFYMGKCTAIYATDLADVCREKMIYHLKIVCKFEPKRTHKIELGFSSEEFYELPIGNLKSFIETLFEEKVIHYKASALHMYTPVVFDLKSSNLF
jgi:hypothetical protein